MPGLEHYLVGSHPEAEAPRLRRLYSDPGIDQSIINEFSETVEAYRTLTLEDIAARIALKYSGPDSGAVGFIGCLDGNDIGMAITGIKDFVMPGETDETPGVNVSGWVLRQYRELGLGNHGALHATQEAQIRVTNPSMSVWFGRKVWTSILATNTPSRRAGSAAGFEEAGPHLEKPGRLIYILRT